ncbi:MAG TPA: hypothetical protein VGG34_05065 [Opitutaceae bacterium]|jgi:hypothetical protein
MKNQTLSRTATALLLTAAALLSSACSTTTIASREANRPVAYAQLHGMMTKLADEQSSWTADGSKADSASVAANTAGTLASNP